MKEVDKQSKLSAGFIFKYYFHRIWRLTPPYMICVLLSTNLSKYLGTGPIYPLEGFDAFCKDSWWTNLLYINNLVKTDEPVRLSLFLF